MPCSPHTIITAVTGAPGVGKSTFIRTLGVPVDRAVLFTETRFPPPLSLRLIGVADLAVIAAGSYATVYVCEIPFFGLPDAPFLSLASFVDNYVIIVDSTRPESCGKARQVIDFLQNAVPGAPRVVVANKQDVDGALSARDVGYILALDGNAVPVLPCCARNHDDVREVLLTLFGRIAAAAETR